MFPVAKCETCFGGDMGQGKQTSLKFKTKDFLPWAFQLQLLLMPTYLVM